MSSRLREALDDLQREVADLRLASPAAVRARGEALRRRRRAGVAVSATLVVAAAAAATVTALRAPEPAPAVPPAGPPTCATAGWTDEAALATSPRVKVFMRLEATPDEVEAVRQSLAGLDLSFQFVGHDEAYEEFKEIYACEPELVRLTDPENLPESFRVTLRDPAQFPGFRDLITRLPGVDLVQKAPQ